MLICQGTQQHLLTFLGGIIVFYIHIFIVVNCGFVTSLEKWPA